MKNMKLISIISIVLISLLAISAVSAAEDATITDDADLAAVEEVETVDIADTNNDVSYENEEIILGATGDSSDSDNLAASDNASEDNLGATLNFAALNTAIRNAEGELVLEDDYSHGLLEVLYYNGITINKNITIDGQGHTINGNGRAHIFNIASGATVVLKNIIFTGASANRGGAIYNNGALTIENSQFLNNTATKPLIGDGGHGGAIFNDENAILELSAYFIENHADREGGAIYNLGIAMLSSSVLANNTANGGLLAPAYGGAIYNKGIMEIDAAILYQNSANGGLTHIGNGGAIYNEGDLHIQSSYLYANVANRGVQYAGDGGAIYNSYGDVNIVNTEFGSNEAARDGGAIYNGGTLSVESSTFKNNYADGGILASAQGLGGAIYNNASATVSDSSFSYNDADLGAALYNNYRMELINNIVENDEVTIYNSLGSKIRSVLYCNINENKDMATSNGTVELTANLTDDKGNLIYDENFAFLIKDEVVPFASFDEITGIYNATYQVPKAGTYLVSANNPYVEGYSIKIYYNTTLTHLQALVNAADSGDMINLLNDYAYFEEFDSALKETGVVVYKDIFIKGNGVTISGSESSRLFTVDEYVTLGLKDLTIANGYSETKGSAIYSLGELDIDNCTIENNYVVENEEETIGGAIFASGIVFIDDSVFRDNLAMFYGGAIYLDNAIAFIKNTEFYENIAANGGAIALIDSELDVSGCTFEDNLALDNEYNIYNFGGGNVIIEDSFFTLIEPSLNLDYEHEYGDVIPVNGTFNWGVNLANLSMIYTIDGMVSFVELDDGKFSFDIDVQPDVGTYTITIASFKNTDGNTFAVNPIVKTFEVVKATPSIEVEGATVPYDTPATVTVKVSKEDMPIDGKVMIVVDWGVDSLTQVIDLEDGAGEATFALTPYVTDGNYTITATYLGNRNFNQAINNTEKIVVLPTTVVNIVIEGGESQIKITMTDETGAPVDGMINVTFDNVTQEVEVVDGVAIVPDNVGGENEVTVSYPGNEQYDPVNVTDTVTVAVPDLTPTNIVITVNNISYGDEAFIEFSLTDITGVPVSGILNVTVGDLNSTVTVVDGVGNLTVPGLNADTYPVVANYEGNDKYLSSTGTGSFNVARNATQIIYVDMNTTAIDYYNDGRIGDWFTFRLIDANGNPIKNTPMLIGFNGVIYDEEDHIVTDENGYAKLQINLMKIDIYTFAICYLGDQNRNASFAVAKINVIGQTPTITARNRSYAASAKTKTFVATFRSNKGTLIPNKKVLFTVNGVTYAAKTNENGVASVNIAISKKGTYKVKVSYDGDSTYNAISKTAVLTIT